MIENTSEEWQTLNNASIWNNVTGISKLLFPDLQAEYRQEFVSEYGDVTLVVSDVKFEFNMESLEANANRTFTFPAIQMPVYPDLQPLRMWIASTDSQGWFPAGLIHGDWYSDNYTLSSNLSLHLDSGFANRGAQNSKIQMSLPFLLIVIACNATKVACFIFMIVKGQTDEELPMVTLGDAVTAFLEAPDENTSGHCTFSKTEYFWATGRIRRTKARQEDGRAEEMDNKCKGYWEKRRNYYGSAISERKRISISTA